MIISSELYSFVNEHDLGQVRTAPFDVFFNQKNAFQPDIIFIARDNLLHLQERGFFGAPNLVIEILSPASWRFDKEDKKDIYERCGVREYWMIDPSNKTAEGFYLAGNEYEPLPEQTGELQLKFLPLVIRF